MNLKNNKVVWIVALVIVSVVGLLIVQSMLLSSAYNSKEKAFEQNVMTALGSVTQKLAATEMLAFAITADSFDLQNNGTHAFSFNLMTEDYATNTSFDTLSIGATDAGVPRVWFNDNQIHYTVKSQQHVELQVIDPATGDRKVIVDTVQAEGQYTVSTSENPFGSGSQYWRLKTDSASVVVRTMDGTSIGHLKQPSSEIERDRIIMAVTAGMQDIEFKSVEERLDAEELNDALSKSFMDAGIDIPYAYAVTEKQNNEPLLISDSTLMENIQNSPYHASLFPHQLLSDPAELRVFFPERVTLIWIQMIPLLLPTVLLTLIVVGCLVYSIRMILSQKRFSEQLVEFIGNMTHEFKTPLATVQLACEAIAKKEVLSKPDRVLKFNDTILKETQRMKHQADKILQMAVLEEGDVELSNDDVDMHALITHAVDVVRMHLSGRDGVVSCDLNAEHSLLRGDTIHLTNIIHNVLDNANKYSAEQPEIHIRTSNQNDGLKITISDNGIGMTREDCDQAFDKYFRVAQGNIHNVKGFGLGLAYVKLMVQAHSGCIALQSEPGDGTMVTITFPASRIMD